MTIATDESWQWSSAVPNAKEGRLGAAAKKEEWKPAVVIEKPVGSWVSKVEAEAPGLLASTSIAKQPMVRASLVKSDFLMRTLGRPNRDQIVSTRPNDLTTLEAIDLANGQTLANYLANGAKTFDPKKWPDSKALTTHLYRHALSRDPSPNELAATQELLGPKPTEQGVQDLLWAICMMPEFLMVR